MTLGGGSRSALGSRLILRSAKYHQTQKIRGANYQIEKAASSPEINSYYFADRATITVEALSPTLRRVNLRSEQTRRSWKISRACCEIGEAAADPTQQAGLFADRINLNDPRKQEALNARSLLQHRSGEQRQLLSKIGQRKQSQVDYQ